MKLGNTPQYEAAQHQRMQGIIYALLGAVLFSAKSIVIKFIYEYEPNATIALGYRLLFALPFFLLVAYFQAQKAKRGELPKLTNKHKLQLMILGFLGYYLASFLDIASLKYISVSLERLILLLSPAFVLILTWLFYRRSVSRVQLLSIILAYIGVFLVFTQDFQLEGSNIVLGSLLVIGSALSYAIYIIIAGELIKTVGSTRFVAYAMSISAVYALIQLFVLHGFDWIYQAWPVYGWSIVHAIFNTVIPTFLLMWAVERIGTTTSTQLGLVGPVSLLFLAYFILGDPISLIDILGTSIVLLGVYLLSRSKKV